MFITRIEQHDNGLGGTNEEVVRIYRHDHTCSREGQDVEFRELIIDGVVVGAMQPLCIESNSYLVPLYEVKAELADGSVETKLVLA